MPLTAAGNLDKHPALSVPFTNQVLEHMVHNMQEMVQREQAALWRIKNIQTQFCGDEPFAVASRFQGDESMVDFEDRQDLGSANMSVVSNTHKSTQPEASWDAMTNNGPVESFESAVETEIRTKSELETANHEDSLLDPQEEQEPQDILAEDVPPGSEPDTAGGNIHSADNPNEHTKQDENRNHESKDAVATDAQISDATDSLKNDEIAGEINGAFSNNQHQETDTVILGGDNRDAPLEDQHKVRLKDNTDLNRTNGTEVQAPASAETEGQAQQPNPVSNGQTHPDTPLADNMSTQDHAIDDANNEGASTTSDGPRRRATRAHTRAQAPEPNVQPTPPLSMLADAPSPHLSVVPTGSAAAQIHPFFLPPPEALPNPAVGLTTPGLANEARRQLSFFVQKQQEVTRQSNELLTGLRKALRLKDTVWDWCRNEAHVGEMSDGEDWIDAEKWDVAKGELRKGEEVEDEDPAGMVVKKTRNRRAAG